MPKVAPARRLSQVRMERFDGGLNLRDAPSELGVNETPDCMNVTLDERGGAASRLGITRLNGASALPTAPTYLYYSAIADALLAYISTDGGVGKLYKSTDGGVTWSAAYSAFTAGAQAAIVDFAGANGGRVVVVNTLDGVYSFPSGLGAPTHTSGGSANMDEVRGSGIALWQNKLWVVGDPREDATHSRARVWYCNAGNEQLWTVATAFVDIRDVDTTACTAIGAGAGMDVTGKATLLVYKESSMYRINDSGTGAYTTLHARGAGASSAKAVAGNLGRICSINHEGIWVTDGLAIPVRVSDKLQPLFRPDGLNFAGGSTWSAAPYLDRVVFNITRAGSNTNNLMLEYHPEVGWAVPHSLALGPMAIYSKQTSKLISTGGANGHIYETFKGGTDNGVAITARYQGRWMPTANGDESRLRQLRVYGRGAADCQIRQNFATTGVVFPLSFGQPSGFAWGVGRWDEGIWGDPVTEGDADTPLDEVCKHVSLFFSNTTSTSTFKPALLGDGISSEIGAWAVYGTNLDVIQLGT